MNANQNWAEALKEISSIIRGIDDIRFVDLWADQVNDPQEEYPFPFPAAFLELTTSDNEDLGENIQDLSTHVKIYLLYIPVYDTHREENSHDLDVFGELLKKIYQALQGVAGDNFSQATRISGPSKEKAQPYEWLYSQTFRTIIRDYSAAKEYKEGELGDITVSMGSKPVEEDNIYEIPG
jgi:hypothetical protein